MKNTELIARLRSFEIDHKPHGWPAIQMRDVSALINEIEALQAEVERLKAACDKFSESELLQQAQPERAPLSDDEIKEITADDSIDSIHDVVRAVEAAHGIKEGRNSEPVSPDHGPITAIIGVGLEYRPDEHERLEWREEMGICLEYADGYRDSFYISELSVVKGRQHD